MSTVRFETATYLASDLGGEDPLAHMPGRPPWTVPVDPDLSPEMQKFFRSVELRGCLPYRVLDRYDRSEEPRPFRVAVVENDILRATVLLELGGRLWSIIHKPTGRELLYKPDVIHYAHVALCNAWICGGSEWNIAVRGHAAFTVRPVFGARLKMDDGTPVLRLYDFDRFRGLMWQLDLFAPDGSPALFVRARTVNPHDKPTAMYWWSNIAVEEAEGHRVLAPAATAYHHAYDQRLREIPVPMNDAGIDTSYPKNSPAAHDWFYKIPEGNRPWIASLDPEGKGLVHASTASLKGRKLFLWGQGRGGRRWQAHLGGRNGRGYVEIQAGLGRTQCEYLQMPAKGEWEWLEAYMLMEADPKIAHSGPGWTDAWRHVQDRLDTALPQARLDAILAETAAMARRPPDEILFRGTGWGALEEKRRRTDGEPPLAPPSIPFDDASLGRPEAQWLELLEKGALPSRPPDEDPGVWMTDAPWRKRLAKSALTPAGDHWLTYLHLGVAAYRHKKPKDAVAAWRKSVEKTPTAWAYRNIARLAWNQGRTAEAADGYLKAARLQPDLVELQLECGRCLSVAKRMDDLETWMIGLPERIRRLPRVDILASEIAMHKGDLATALATLESVHITDNREGDNSISDLWYELKARQAAAAEGVPLTKALRERIIQTLEPPAHLDYRMAKPLKKVRKRAKK